MLERTLGRASPPSRSPESPPSPPVGSGNAFEGCITLRKERGVGLRRSRELPMSPDSNE